ncbi:hypothetical protein Xkoz_02667 [Xenorhabdus kozodoii]|uniref:Uncharacterized protein n=1 Tax=Xenorhabdus kozodoii TaxID=351676 RepID=A0A2D0L7G3_9GAMM|nr:hypothetical protein Xkoz_02667 [Xenorhabdus kozodoii]
MKIYIYTIQLQELLFLVWGIVPKQGMKNDIQRNTTFF